MQPLDGPVVPEVYMITHRSAGLISGRSNSAWHPAEVGQLAEERDRLAEAETVGDDPDRLGLGQLMAEELAPEVGVDRDLHHPGLGAGVDEHDVLDLVGQHEGEAVALAEPQLLEAGGNPIRGPVELTEGHPIATTLDEIPIGGGLDLLPEQVAEDPGGW